MAEALLNAAVEASVCQKMLKNMRLRLDMAEQAVSSTILDRETYLIKMGGVRELRETLSQAQAIYDQNFNV